MNRRRLEVEAWRDAMLAVAGKLDRAARRPAGDLGSPNNRRRTLYGRGQPARPGPAAAAVRLPRPEPDQRRARPVTTVPLQQLFVLNSPFMVRQAKALAAGA